MFRVGQKVACVNAANGSASSKYGAGSNCGLRKGAIYTISAVRGEFVDVAELASNGWFADRFRPLVETKTDISIFTKMLTGETINA